MCYGQSRLERIRYGKRKTRKTQAISGRVRLVPIYTTVTLCLINDQTNIDKVTLSSGAASFHVIFDHQCGSRGLSKAITKPPRAFKIGPVTAAFNYLDDHNVDEWTYLCYECFSLIVSERREKSDGLGLLCDGSCDSTSFPRHCANSSLYHVTWSAPYMALGLTYPSATPSSEALLELISLDSHRHL